MRTCHRSTLVALFGRVAERGGPPESVFMASEVSQWPKGAADALMNARLLREMPLADSVTCFACEEQCRRLVATGIDDGGPPQRVNWTCHLYDDLGPLDGPVELLRRFSSSREMVAKFLARACKLEVREHDSNWRRISFSALKIGIGTRAFRIEFNGNALVKVGAASIDLIELLNWDGSPSLDLAALTAAFEASDDAQSGGKRVQPSTTIREDGKFNTHLRNRRLQQRLDALAAKNPHLNKEQLARKLIKLGEGEGEGMSAGRLARVTRMRKKVGRKNFA